MNNHIFLPSFAMENTPKIHSSRIRSRNCRMKHNNDFSYFTLDVNSKNTIFPDDISRGRFKNNKMKVSSVPTSPNNK